MLTLSLAMLGFSVIQAMQPDVSPPPLDYSQAEYQLTKQSSVCAGDALNWNSQLNVYRDATVTRYRTIWNVAEQRTVWFDSTPIYAIWNAGEVIKTQVVFPVPTLPPAEYEVRVSAITLNAEEARYTVPFTVRACPP